MSLNIPAAVAERLKALTGGANANTDFGLSRITSWPGYPNPRTTVEADVSFEVKWDDKFFYYPGGQKAEKDAFSVTFSFVQTNDAQGVRHEFVGMPMTIPFDRAGFQGVKDDKANKTADMAEARLATCLAAALSLDNAEWKARFQATGWGGMFEALDARIKALEASASRLNCKVDLTIDKFPKRNDDGTLKPGEKDAPTGVSGKDVIRECMNQNLPQGV